MLMFLLFRVTVRLTHDTNPADSVKYLYKVCHRHSLTKYKCNFTTIPEERSTTNKTASPIYSVNYTHSKKHKAFCDQMYIGFHNALLKN